MTNHLELPFSVEVLVGLTVILFLFLFILGVQLGKTSKGPKKALTIADVEEEAFEDLAKMFWNADITHSQFGEMAQETREAAWLDKQKLEKKLLRKSARNRT